MKKAVVYYVLTVLSLLLTVSHLQGVRIGGSYVPVTEVDAVSVLFQQNLPGAGAVVFSTLLRGNDLENSSGTAAPTAPVVAFGVRFPVWAARSLCHVSDEDEDAFRVSDASAVSDVVRTLRYVYALGEIII